jgi:microcystin-dependent protein
MGQQYLGEIRIVAFPFAPKGWAQCNGQLMPINQNQALFSLLGATYGGDGRTTFGLPDFRGRTGMSWGSQGGSPTFVYGRPGGEEMHTLVTNEIPLHNHTPVASTQGAESDHSLGESLGDGTKPVRHDTPEYADGDQCHWQ